MIPNTGIAFIEHVGNDSFNVRVEYGSHIHEEKNTRYVWDEKESTIYANGVQFLGIASLVFNY